MTFPSRFRFTDFQNIILSFLSQNFAKLKVFKLRNCKVNIGRGIKFVRNFFIKFGRFSIFWAEIIFEANLFRLICRNSSPEIRSFMRYHNITSFQELESYYIQRVLAITRNLNTKPVVWQEVFDNGVRLTDDAVVHVWQLESYEAEMDLVSISSYLARFWITILILNSRDFAPGGSTLQFEAAKWLTENSGTSWVPFCCVPCNNFILYLFCLQKTELSRGS